MRILSVFVAAALVVWSGGTSAQDDYPSKPIRIVVPFTPGGIADSIARTIGNKLASKYGKPVVVENRAGAGGLIGGDYVAKAAPDGYTLLLATPNLSVLPNLQKAMPWLPDRDFAAIGRIGVVPNIFVVRTDSPIMSISDLVKAAKAGNGNVTFGSAGLGSMNHIGGEMLAQEKGVKMTHVPYKGQPEAIGDLLTGRLTTMPLTAALALPQIKAGKLRALAVTSSRRLKAAPDVPTVAEAAGIPGYEVVTWFGLVAPIKTPKAILEKLDADLAAAMESPDVIESFEGLGMIRAWQNGRDFGRFIAVETESSAKLLKEAGIEPN